MYMNRFGNYLTRSNYALNISSWTTLKKVQQASDPEGKVARKEERPAAQFVSNLSVSWTTDVVSQVEYLHMHPMQFTGKRSVFVFLKRKQLRCYTESPDRIFATCVHIFTLPPNKVFNKIELNLQYDCQINDLMSATSIGMFSVDSSFAFFFGYFTPWENSWTSKWQNQTHLNEFCLSTHR